MVTGGSRGIGLMIAQGLLEAGATVTVSSRKQADLNRHLARRLASEQITVNAIAPGPFESKMTAFMLEILETHGLIEQTVPLGRIGRPDDAAGLMIFLALRAGSYLTGAVIPLDGGITGCSSG
jgi:NAD(P)-dependent dehydrogenase (short-subunit alcohol dehydrogenase family)